MCDADVRLLETAEPIIQELLKISKTAYSNSYSPYSKVCVGAALLCDDGKIIKGCNVENSSFSVTVCAERTALCTAIAEGYRKFKAIAISSNIKDQFTYPCGACRQFMSEFGTDWDVYLVLPDFSYRKTTVEKLLPYSFHLKDVKLE